MTDVTNDFSGASVKSKQGPTEWDIYRLITAAEKNDVLGIDYFVFAFGKEHIDDYGTNGWTALTYAASRDGDNVVDAVRILLKYGADVEKRTNHGDGNEYTPLMVAATNFMSDVVKLLVEAGADPTVTDQFGHTPRQIYARRAYRDFDAPAPANDPNDILTVLDAATVKWKQSHPAPKAPAAPKAT